MAHPLNPLFNNWPRVHDASEEPVLRLRIRPDVDEDGQPPIPDRPKGSKRLHTHATVTATRRLIEETTLSYKQIAARTGVSHGTVRVWTRDGGWTRHPMAPVASETVPGARAGRRLKLRVLREKLFTLAERCVTELWNSPTVDLDRLIEAMQVVKMARLEAMARRRPRKHPDSPARTGQEWADRGTEIRTALKEMRRAGVNINRIPDAAMALLEDAHTPPERDNPAFRARGPRRRS